MQCKGKNYIRHKHENGSAKSKNLLTIYKNKIIYNCLYMNILQFSDVYVFELTGELGKPDLGMQKSSYTSYIVAKQLLSGALIMLMISNTESPEFKT